MAGHSESGDAGAWVRDKAGAMMEGPPGQLKSAVLATRRSPLSSPYHLKDSGAVRRPCVTSCVGKDGGESGVLSSGCRTVAQTATLAAATARPAPASGKHTTCYRFNVVAPVNTSCFHWHSHTGAVVAFGDSP